MQTIYALIEQHSAYFSFLAAALCSFFFSLPKDLNPLSAFALIFQEIGKKVNLPERSDGYKRLASVLSFALIFLPIVLIMSQLYIVAFAPSAIDIIVLYVLLSWHDKMTIYKAINTLLKGGQVANAKLLLSQLTLRDTKPLSLLGTNKATIESLVLQISNGWFSVIFWYLVGGIYGALFYQLLNISAQQWNCKYEKFQIIGQIPSFISKLLQLPVHFILSFTFSLYDKPIKHLFSKFKQSIEWHHFSSGLLLSSFALSIQTQLGGVRMYEEVKITYANLGSNNAPEIDKVGLAIHRLTLSAWFWLICITSYEFLPQLFVYFDGTYHA